VATVQTISGTGALSLVANFFKRFTPDGTKIYLPRPSWGNHRPVFSDADIEVGEYGYYNPATCGLDFDGMVADIEVGSCE
jgi:aspartate aminotransferase, mitochondrial